MDPEWIYLLKVNAGIVFFYLFYKILCQYDTFFQWRRFSLLGFLIFSLLYPLVDIQDWVMEQPALHELADNYTAWLGDERMVDISTAGASATEGINWNTLLIYGYFLGVMVLSIRFLAQLTSTCWMRWKGKPTYLNGQRIISLPFEANPFSFFGWIFLYLPELDEKNQDDILMHEQAHARQWHSVDVIFSEIVNIICWFNPFSWLLKSEIRLNLEFLADNKVTENMENYQSYQRHLLDLTHMDYRIGLCNNFNVSSLKTRILMMNRKRTHVVAYLKYAFFLPLIVALFLFSNLNCTSNEKMNPLVHQAEKETPAQVVEESIEPDSEKNIPMETPVEEEKIAQPVEKTEETPKEVSITEVKNEETSQPVAESVVHEKNASAAGEIIEEYSQIGEDLQDYKEDWESGMEEPAAEEQAVYQPGKPLLFSLLLKNLRYPPELIQEGIQGEVIIEAINRKDGELTDIKLIRGVHPLLDNEVLRVMNEMPKGAYYKHKRKRDPILTLPILFEIIGNRVKVTM